MIVIKVDKLEDFVSFLNRRLGNEIFYEFANSTADMGTRAILCYLAKIDGITVLYQGEITFPNVRDHAAIKKKLDEFEFEDIHLVAGKVREIVMSIS
ncbi:MAG: hypothetical protein HWN66_17535 [Candidatus Helarchaeota archaeon]|nr:hypothetical protein [Candidatus Helarchaeota archaeon]